MRRRPEELALLAEQPYADQNALLEDLCLWLDALLAAAYDRDAWVGRDPRMRDLMGLVIPREEFESALDRAGDLTAWGEGREAEEIDRLLCMRMAQTSGGVAYLEAVRRLGLTALEEKCLRLALATHLDEKYEKLFAYLQDDVTRKQPSLRLGARLCAEAGTLVAEAAHRIARSPRLRPLLDAPELEKGVLAPGAPLLDALFAPAPQEAERPETIPLHPEQVDVLRRLCKDGAQAAVLLCGREGSGRRTALRCASGRPVISCRAQALEEGLARAALGGALLAVECAGEGAPDLEAVPPALRPVFLLAQEGTAYLDGEGTPALRLHFPPPNDAQREALFCLHMRLLGVRAEARAGLLASKFLFTPGRVAGAMRIARQKQDSLGRDLNDGELHEACYDLLAGQGGEMTAEGEGGLTMEDLVLPRMQKEQLRQAVEQVLLRRKVYESWGFAEKTPYGKGVSILLSGPPGTGKTMAARVLAGELHLHLHIVQLSQVISKYIGETEKNLRRVFEQAREGSWVLFFDECDALFGKRGEVREAQDRHANAEVAFLLQQMEAFDGVTLLATNLSQNMDAAFMRRMRFVVHFPFPDEAAREALYRRLLPPRAPVDPAVDYRFLAQKFAISGGNIKNVVLHAAFLAAARGGPIGMAHLLRAAVDEQRKNEVVVVREELRQYADLMDGALE